MRMRGVMVALCIFLGVTLVQAQDFVSRFLEMHQPDSNLTCITISPKMMKKIVSSDAGKNEELLDMIAELRSMQLLKAQVGGESYYTAAVELLDKNNKRFETFAVDTHNDSANSRVAVCKKHEDIIELVMLTNVGEQFTVVNFTGNMDEEFISRLTEIFAKPIDEASSDN